MMPVMPFPRYGRSNGRDNLPGTGAMHYRHGYGKDGSRPGSCVICDFAGKYRVLGVEQDDCQLWI
ncbi:hypothetical protein A6M21_06965 [Desulfotomaculum copahuensis]|uniref:Uncharacterized protein n=1 Tax=Desulfotomaculum copahuensis TaxID=1838280 RepID=A0A1B7LGQ8_9FIRM|nr:hypothetical protein A6M21_06965 [Desulfotomaculum copahuensis]